LPTDVTIAVFELCNSVSLEFMWYFCGFWCSTYCYWNFFFAHHFAVDSVLFALWMNSISYIYWQLWQL